MLKAERKEKNREECLFFPEPSDFLVFYCCSIRLKCRNSWIGGSYIYPRENPEIYAKNHKTNIVIALEALKVELTFSGKRETRRISEVVYVHIFYLPFLFLF